MRKLGETTKGLDVMTLFDDTSILILVKRHSRLQLQFTWLKLNSLRIVPF